GNSGGATELKVASTSWIRSAETAARGAIIVTIVAIITADMISERYVMNATSEPTDMPPLSMRCAPNQITEMLDAFTTNIIVGNMSAMRRQAFNDVALRSSLTRCNRS